MPNVWKHDFAAFVQRPADDYDGIPAQSRNRALLERMGISAFDKPVPTSAHRASENDNLSG